MYVNRNPILEQLHSADPGATAVNAYLLVDTLQDLAPAQQVQALGLLFLVLCAEFKLPVRDAFEVGERILRDAEAEHSEAIRAIRAYIKGELQK